jgi:hypothetical protein
VSVCILTQLSFFLYQILVLLVLVNLLVIKQMLAVEDNPFQLPFDIKILSILDLVILA